MGGRISGDGNQLMGSEGCSSLVKRTTRGREASRCLRCVQELEVQEVSSYVKTAIFV